MTMQTITLNKNPGLPHFPSLGLIALAIESRVLAHEKIKQGQRIFSIIDLDGSKQEQRNYHAQYARIYKNSYWRAVESLKDLPAIKQSWITPEDIYCSPAIAPTEEG